MLLVLISRIIGRMMFSFIILSRAGFFAVYSIGGFLFLVAEISG